MSTLLNMLLVNAVVVVPLAGVVWGVSRLARRPALTHVLWVLVLLKLITPPFLRLPFSISIPVASQATHDGVAAILPKSQDKPLGSAPAPGGDQLVHSVIATDNRFTSSTGEPIADDFQAAISAPEATSGFLPSAWFHWTLDLCQKLISQWQAQPALTWSVLVLWCAGTIAWFVLQGLGALRFWRGIERGSSMDPKLQRQARQVAEQFGLRRCPQVMLVEAQLSPMLWGYGGRLRLLFPADLARRLNHDARGTLLAHELAHYSRGDHWIRVLELIVMGVYWWHPVVWLARRQIEESEEECCDAWVVTALPHTPRRYAEALLDTIDFLCDAPAALPPLASGLGPAAFLRRRLTRIMQGVSPKDLSPRQRCGVLMIATLALPLQPFVLGSNAAARRPQQLEVPTLVQSTSAPSSVTFVEPVEQVVTPEANQVPTTPAIASSLPPAPRSSRSGRSEPIWGTAVSPNGHFAVDTTGRRVILTNLATNEQSDLPIRDLTSVAFFPDGDSFVAGGSDGRVTIWSSAKGALLRTLYTHDNAVRSVAVSPRGDLIAMGSPDGSIQLLDTAASPRIVEVSRAESAVNCVRFSPDGRRLAAAIGDWESDDPGQIAIWNLQSGRLDNELKCDSAPGALCFVSSDELIVGQWNGHTSLWNLVNAQVVASKMADKRIVASSSFSPDNPMLREVPFEATSQTGDVAADLQALGRSAEPESLTN